MDVVMNPSAISIDVRFTRADGEAVTRGVDVDTSTRHAEGNIAIALRMLADQLREEVPALAALCAKSPC